MDDSAFDEVTRLVSAVGSRRALLAGVAASLALGEEAAGKQNRHHRHRRRRRRRARQQNQACDVCASGCPYSKIDDPIGATPAGGTIRVCPGNDLRRPGDQRGESWVLDIAKSMTIQGAGQGQTVLAGGGKPNNDYSVVRNSHATVTLRGLSVIGANGAAAIEVDSGTLTLEDVLVRSNVGKFTGASPSTAGR